MASASFNNTDADELMQYQYQLFEAAHNGDLELFKRMATLLDGGRGRLREVVQAAMVQDTGSWDGMGALHIAASQGRLEVCRYLIEELRLDVDDADQGGSTPLMAAIAYNHISIVNYLLYHGADVNKAEPAGSTPLHCATHLGDCGMIQQLLAKGASVDPIAYCGTPLHVAATKGRDGAMKILLENGADFKKMVDGETPLDAAKRAGKLECVNLLIEASIVCRHYSNQEVTDMKNNWIQILSSKTAASCEHCWKDPPTKQQDAGSKEKKKKMKKGGGARGAAAKEQAKVEKSHLWACLVCGQYYCGGVNTKPRGHAEAHCSRNKHWWVVNRDDSVTVYCFKCRKDFLFNLSNSSSPPKKEKAKYKQKETTTLPMEKLENNLGLSCPISKEGITVSKSADSLMGIHHHTIKGLPNTGNACFFNVMLQNLLALDSLRIKMIGEDVWTGPLSVSLKELFLETSASNSAQRLLNSKNLIAAICSVWPQFKEGTMEDAAELLHCFLSGLHDEGLSVDVSNEKVTTIVDSLFRGQDCSTVSSKGCAHGSASYQGFLSLSLPIPPRKLPAMTPQGTDGHVSLEECFDLYTEQELLANWYCESCSDSTNKRGDSETDNLKENEKTFYRTATRRTLVTKAPNVLVVSLNRFRQVSSVDYEKIEGHVHFKEMFDIQNYMDQRSVDTGKTIYQLVGIIQHIGTPRGGHYCAYVRAGKMEGQQKQSESSKSWFYASDEHIREASLDEVLSCEAYMLFYERCSTNAYQYSANSTGEVSQLTDNSMQPRTGAPVIKSPPPPPQVQIKPWEFQRDPNRNKRRSNAMSQDDDIIAQNIGVFLDRFILRGDKKPYYHCEMITMVERGSGSRELNVLYPHLLIYSKGLALEVCNRYERLKVYLKETARLFVQKLLTAESNLTDTAREQMQELATVGSAQCLELKFLEMPKTHKLLKDYLKPPLTKPMKVFGHKGQPIRTPLPNKCALVQRLISDVLSKHRAGLSWEGELTLDDMDIYDDKVVITKIPKSFLIEPQISNEMIIAMEKDFDTIAQTILKKFQSPMTSIPYLNSFYNTLSDMSDYAEWWSNVITAEALRELIEHHPFLKSSMARSNLLSGIFNAFKSYDAGDHTVLFKKILELSVNLVSWVAETRKATNRMVRNVFIRKDQKQGQMAPGPNPGTGTATTEATATADAAGTKPVIDPTRESRTESARTADAAGTEATTTADATNPKTVAAGYYEESMGLLIEFLRHLSQHGSECSFDRPFTAQRSHPRKQLMKSLDETEVAGAILLESRVMRVLNKLLRSSAMVGMLESVWNCYKSSNSSFQA